MLYPNPLFDSTMAAKNIQSDDLILVNRGGVDYQAKVSDLPIEDADVDHSGLMPLDLNTLPELT